MNTHTLETMLRRYHGIDDDAGGMFKGNDAVWKIIIKQWAYDEITAEQAKLGVKSEEAEKKRAERNAHDFYATPAWAVQLIMDALYDDGLFPDPGNVGIDPFAGGDKSKDHIMPFPHIIKSTMRDFQLRNQLPVTPLGIDTFDIRPESPADHAGVNFFTDDFIRILNGRAYDFCFTNPPFSSWTACFSRLINSHIMVPSGIIGFLGRTNMMASQKRKEWVLANHPNVEYRLAERPSFTGQGNDWYDYSFFVWLLGDFNPRWTRVRTI